jgi:glycosyltransferase involved in cell wall biosynthesis
MRVLLIARTIAFGGGTETLVYETFHELKKQIGIENVKLVVFQHTSIFNVNDIDHYEKILDSDSNFHCLNDNIKLRFLRKNKINTSELQEIVSNFKPTIIHSHLYLSELISRNIKYNKAKWFSHFHDNMEQFENFNVSTLLSKKKLINYYEKRFLFSKYNKNNFIAISEDTYNFAKKRIRGNKLFLLHNGMNLKNYERIQEIKHDKIRLINIGSFVEKKNQKFIIEIALELKASNTEFEIIVLGDGPLRREFDDLILKNKLTNEIKSLGIVENVNYFLNQSNIYLHTAKYEPFGLVLIESMACSLPVISLNGRGNKDIVINNFNGIMIENEDALIFCKHILKVFNDKTLYNKLSNNATEFAKKYDIKNYVENLISIYNS